MGCLACGGCSKGELKLRYGGKAHREGIADLDLLSGAEGGDGGGLSVECSRYVVAVALKIVSTVCKRTQPRKARSVLPCVCRR